MGDKTKISWADASWNPTTGCTKVSAGCDNCYIETTPPFRIEGRKFLPLGVNTGASTDVRLHPDRLDQPMRWQRPRRIFVNSLSDLMHKKIPLGFIAHVFAVMALTSRHQFLLLTKRPARLRSLLRGEGFRRAVAEYATNIIGRTPSEFGRRIDTTGWTTERLRPSFGDTLGNNLWVPPWPLPNLWVGVSAEDQVNADRRVPLLLDTPAAVRFLSLEPLLGPIEFRYRGHPGPDGRAPLLGRCGSAAGSCSDNSCRTRIDWVIVGGESGPLGADSPRRARPMDIAWAHDLRQQTADAGVAFHMKQLGSVLAHQVGAPGKGAHLADFPPELRVQEYPC